LPGFFIVNGKPDVILRLHTVLTGHNVNV